MERIAANVYVSNAVEKKFDAELEVFLLKHPNWRVLSICPRYVTFFLSFSPAISGYFVVFDER